ncbi:MAG: CaiB/BaiF CoA-transferase family protein [Thermodesulfobacteriota bacterium]|nr:CaiB/BaiF CoA-transferase family protein [Thermodesulfobacteriota bacterium]
MLENGALTGIKVVDLSRLLPGPYCSMILADHGARVIAVEDKRFLADGLFLSTVNRNKEHITLDLKSEQGKAIFFQLIADADVVLEGFRPGVVEKLGVDYKAVSEKNPKIVYCSVSGYGQIGANRDRSGHDANYLAMAGVLDLIGENNRQPVIPGVQFADIAGGGMNGVIGILLALMARDKTGRGQYIDISMTDSMVSFMPVVLFLDQELGMTPGRGNSLLSDRYACYTTYRTKNDRYIAIGALENRFWQRLCDHMGVPEYGPLQFDEPRREEILDFMRRRFREKPLDQWADELAGVDTCWAPVQGFREVLDDPFFAEREMVVELEGKNGKTSKTIGVPVKLSDTPGSVRTPPDGFGESTTAVLRELGYTGEQIQQFSDNGVI